MKTLYINEVLAYGLRKIVPGEKYFAIGMRDDTDSGEYTYSDLGELEKRFGAKVEILANTLNPRYLDREGVYMQPAWVVFPKEE